MVQQQSGDFDMTEKELEAVKNLYGSRSFNPIARIKHLFRKGPDGTAQFRKVITARVNALDKEIDQALQENLALLDDSAANEEIKRLDAEVIWRRDTIRRKLKTSDLDSFIIRKRIGESLKFLEQEKVDLFNYIRLQKKSAAAPKKKMSEAERAADVKSKRAAQIKARLEDPEVIAFEKRLAEVTAEMNADTPVGKRGTEIYKERLANRSDEEAQYYNTATPEDVMRRDALNQAQSEIALASRGLKDLEEYKNRKRKEEEHAKELERKQKEFEQTPEGLKAAAEKVEKEKEKAALMKNIFDELLQTPDGKRLNLEQQKTLRRFIKDNIYREDFKRQAIEGIQQMNESGNAGFGWGMSWFDQDGWNSVYS